MKLLRLTSLLLAFSLTIAPSLSPPIALAQSPDQLTQQGNAAYAANDYPRAAAIWRQILENDPNNVEALTNLCEALRWQDKYEEAIASFNRALELNPNYAPAYVGLGNTFRNQDQYEESIAAFNRALALDANSASAHNVDGFGSMIEVHPADTQLVPGKGATADGTILAPGSDVTIEVRSDLRSPYSAVHAAISVPASREEIAAIAICLGMDGLRKGARQ